MIYHYFNRWLTYYLKRNINHPRTSIAAVAMSLLIWRSFWTNIMCSTNVRVVQNGLSMYWTTASSILSIEVRMQPLFRWQVGLSNTLVFITHANIIRGKRCDKCLTLRHTNQSIAHISNHIVSNGQLQRNNGRNSLQSSPRHQNLERSGSR